MSVCQPLAHAAVLTVLTFENFANITYQPNHIISAMIVTRIIEEPITIEDSISFYSDHANNLNNLLNHVFLNKCRAGCLIIKINRIINTSPGVIDFVKKSACRVNVEFEVTAIVYAELEVITNCVVKHKSNQIITATAKHATITIPVDSRTNFMVPGSVVAVRVGRAKYPANSATIMVNAYPFVHRQVLTKRVIMYSPTNAIVTQTAKDAIKVIENNINDELAAIEKVSKDKQKLDFFKRRMSYDEQSQTASPTKVTSTDIMSVFGLGAANNRLYAVPHGSYIFRDAFTIAGDDVFSVVDGKTSPLGTEDQSAKKSDDLKYVRNDSLSMSSIAIILLTEYYEELRVIREFLEIYNTEDLVKKNIAFFRAMKR